MQIGLKEYAGNFQKAESETIPSSDHPIKTKNYYRYLFFKKDKERVGLPDYYITG